MVYGLELSFKVFEFRNSITPKKIKIIFQIFYLFKYFFIIYVKNNIRVFLTLNEEK